MFIEAPLPPHMIETWEKLGFSVNQKISIMDEKKAKKK